MPRVKTEQLTVGMVVSKGVKNLDDMLLVPEGCALTQRQINILQAWGISDVEVQGDNGASGTGDPLSRLPPEVVAKLTAEVRRLFWKLNEEDAVAMEVFRLALVRHANKGANA